MLDSRETLLLWVIGGVLGFVLMVIIIRWVFGINSALRKQEAMLRLLQEIAKQQGVNSDTVDAIYKAAQD